ncbi:MAG: methyltransferase domain-containing protein, partial [Chloroflexota bacterium]
MDSNEQIARIPNGTEMADVDASTDPAARVEYLDAVTRTAAYKEETYRLLEIKPGDAVLDVGCGAGDDVRAMAEIVGQTGRAVGLDVSRTMIEAAKRRSEGSALPVEFVQASAYELPFEDDSFDASRIDRV